MHVVTNVVDEYHPVIVKILMLPYSGRFCSDFCVLSYLSEVPHKLAFYSAPYAVEVATPVTCIDALPRAAVGFHLITKRMLHHKHNNGDSGCQLWSTGGSVVADKCN